MLVTVVVSPFELTYGVSPPLALDCTRLIAEDPVCPGKDKLCAHIQQINEKELKALSGVTD
jgi:hypothetical protein